MRKPDLNFVIDTLAFFSFLCLISTGILIFFVLPPGSGNLLVWGMNRHGWGDIHFWIAMTFLLLMILHFILHWDWIINKIKGRAKSEELSMKRITIATIILIIAILILLAPFLSTVENSGGQGESEHAEHVELLR